VRSLVVGVLVLASCYRTDIQLRAPGGPHVASMVNDQMHLSVIGIVEVSSAIDMADACNGNVDSIHEEVSVVGGIVNLVLGTFVPVLNVHNPTVNCGTAAGPGR